MAGAVAVGMFHAPRLAGVIMASHYLAALGTGLVLRFHRGRERSPDARATGPGVGGPGAPPAGWGATGAVHRPGHPSVLARAVRELEEARLRDGRPLGQVLGDAVRDSVQVLLLVGGFIIVFAVAIDVLARVGVVGAVSHALGVVLRPLGASPATASALVSGFLEITIGVRAAADAPGPLLVRLAAANAVIAWSGLSVLAQVAAVMQGTGVSLRPYLFARVLQAVLAAALTVWFWNPAWGTPAAVPALAVRGTAARSAAGLPPFGPTLAASSGLLVAAVAVLIAVALGCGALPRLVVFRPRPLRSPK
jgi:hypothetical protein